ncbi:hypothetical protein OK016_23355 [Vibrio chagasii]|nr:hypothetical protein [Vibrio chagasii]
MMRPSKPANGFSIGFNLFHSKRLPKKRGDDAHASACEESETLGDLSLVNWHLAVENIQIKLITHPLTLKGN